MDNIRRNSKLICYENDSTPKIQHTFTIAVVNGSETMNTHSPAVDPMIVFDVFKKIVLNCTLANDTNAAKIQWFKNDQQITEITYFPDDNKRQLCISNATHLNEGVYKCAVEHRSNGDEKIILYETFKVTFEPYWSTWSQWSRCQPKKCGNRRVRRRFRICHQPKILQPITQWRCHGENIQKKRCPTAPCEDGVWSEWSDWSGCSRTCGTGQMFRHRECIGDRCNGQNVEVIDCFRIHCRENVREFSDRSRFLPYQTIQKI